MTIRVDAIVLKSTPHQESGLLLQLFTLELGFIHAIGTPSKIAPSFSITPLMEGAFFIKKSRSELFKIVDLHIFRLNQPIKENWSKLKVASDFLNLIRKTQIGFKPSPPLFHLFSLFLKELNETNFPFHLMAAFYLKVMRYEGLFDIEDLAEKTTILTEKIIALAFSKQFEKFYEVGLTEGEADVIKRYCLELFH